MIKRIKKWLDQRQKKQGKREEVNLLIIGPPSCGKTAIIYFLYQFANMKLRGFRQERSGPSEAITPRPGSSSSISEVELSVFINEIKRETVSSFDFVGTESNTIKYINYDTGNLLLRIYNISGEIFSDTNKNEKMLKDFANHIENIDISKTYTLLCYECCITASERFNIDINSVSTFFGANHLENAHNIFTNIADNIRTLRIVTKFDLIHQTVKPESGMAERLVNFEIIHEPLYLLNQHDSREFMTDHAVSYQIPEPQIFTGSDGKRYWKKFICTGLYDKKDFSKDIYERDEQSGKNVLKEKFRGNGMVQLNMFGITEIFSFILQKSRVFKHRNIIKPLSRGTSTRYKITDADYRKIIGIEK
jgi:hypothetical protein